jgi:hypothetical protein
MDTTTLARAARHIAGVIAMRSTGIRRSAMDTDDR